MDILIMFLYYLVVLFVIKKLGFKYTSIKFYLIYVVIVILTIVSGIFDNVLK